MLLLRTSLPSKQTFVSLASIKDAREIIRNGEIISIPATEASALLTIHKYKLLDVRPPWEHQKASIAESYHIPLFIEDKDMSPLTLVKKWIHFGYIGMWMGHKFTTRNSAFLEQASHLVPSKQDKLLIACGEGLRSMLAAELLYKDGYTNLACLEGGFGTANNESFPEVIGKTPIQYASIGGISQYLLGLILGSWFMETPWSLFVRQEIPPAANVGSFIADWLPEFLGFSWFAYGARSKVVIASAPSPSNSGEFGMGLSFQQVIDTKTGKFSDGNAEAMAICWAPRSTGELAVMSGNLIHIFHPKSLSNSQSSPKHLGLPLEWEPYSILSHSFSILHFAWTDSGDGIISSGSKVVMWKQDVSGWHHVWQSQLYCPQGVTSATWSFKGLAASADGAAAEGEHSRGKAVIWWWEEGMNLQEVELSHPRHVSAIQWRPSTESSHRPVLITSCKDGVVRLWMEIDSGKTRSDRNAGREVSEKCLKPAFFVSAVIDTNIHLQGMLGKDCFLTWARESCPDTIQPNATPCEWIVGAGPQGTVTLWSLHCLDDTNPPRCPRVLLWEQGKNLLTEQKEKGVLFAKAFVQRPQGSLSCPPSVLDMFEVLEDGVLRCSRVWPPVSSISGSGTSTESARSGSANRKNSWGKSSEVLTIAGHTGNEIDLVIHPVILTRLAASIDRTKTILLWYITPGFGPSLEVPSLHISSWKSCGRITTSFEGHASVFSTLAWVPFLPSIGKAVLLYSHYGGVSCFLISSSSKQSNLHHELIHTLQFPSDRHSCSLNQIQVVSRSVNQEDSSVIVVGIGDDGEALVSWKLQLDTAVKSSDSRCEAEGSVIASSCFLNCVTGQSQVRSFATVVGTSYSAAFYDNRRRLVFPFDFMTGCEDGTIKLWKLRNNSGNPFWECVGVIMAHSEPVKLVTTIKSGVKIASSPGGKFAKIKIWELSNFSSFGYVLDGEIAAPEPVSSMEFFSGSDGHLILGVATRSRLMLYVEGRSSGSDSWICFASFTSSSAIDRICWEPQGSVILLSGSAMYLLSPWLLLCNRSGTDIKSSLRDQLHMERTTEVAENLTSPLPSCHPTSILSLLYEGKQLQARACLRSILLSETGTYVFEHIHLSDLYASNISAKLASPEGDMIELRASDTKHHGTTWQFGKDVSFQSVQQDNREPFTDVEWKRLITNIESSNNDAELLAILDLMREMDCSSQFTSLDRPGQRFALSLRFKYYQLVRTSESAVDSTVTADTKAMAWALLSDCKDTLVDMFLQDKVSWPALRALGFGFWFTDGEKLRSRMEKLARVQFLEKRDPKDCALLYLALGRRTVLSGLFKLSRDERDKPLVNFLARNFQEDCNKVAALKNAYVLMGKHRHELAAAFFVLGGDLQSAVSVCLHNLKDPQLAIVISRLGEDVNGASLREIIQRELLPNAQMEDKWLACLLRYLLGERIESMKELVGSEPVRDPDVGHFCRTIFSKPGVQPDRLVASRAAQIEALALRRTGLPLQAVEALERVAAIIAKDLPVVSAELNREKLSWVDPDVVQEITQFVERSLILQYLSPFLRLGSRERVRDQKNKEKFAMDLAEAETRFHFDTVLLTESLASASWFNQNYSLWCWLLASGRFFHEERANRFIDAATTHLPKLLCSTLLSCGASVSSFLYESKFSYKDIKVDLSREYSTEILQTSEAGWDSHLPLSLIQELVICAREISQVALSYAESKMKQVSWVVFLLLLGSAWLRRDTKKLLFLMNMIMVLPLHQRIPITEQDFQDFYTFIPTESDASRESDIGTDDWQMMGLALWNFLASIASKHFRGSSGEASYSSYGRVSPRSSTVTSIAQANLKTEAAESVVAEPSLDQRVLASINVISSGFRRQLVSQSRSLTEKNPLFMFLFGDDSNDIPQQVKSYGSSVDGSMMQLWELLSVKEKVRSAFKLEGLSGTKTQQTGWISTPDTSQPDGPLKRQVSRTFNVKGLLKTRFSVRFNKAEEAMQSNGELLEAICVNSTNSEQAVIASNHKGLVYLDLKTHQPFLDCEDNLWAKADWPRNGWAGTDSTPVPTFVSPGVGLGSKEGSAIGLGGGAVGAATFLKSGKIGAGFGVPGYAGMASWGLGWQEWEDFDGYVDPPANTENVSATSMAAHPLRPFFLVGARNTHVYLWQFGKPFATATYGVLPAVNVPPPYALASVSAVKFDGYGTRFATATVDGTVCTWQLEVGGRSNVFPTQSYRCFERRTSDVAYLVGSGTILAAAGQSHSGENLVIWNTLAPPSSARIAVTCHEGGARCLDWLDYGSGDTPLIITGGKCGDVCVHDFRYITTGKSKYNSQDTARGMVWFIPKAHGGSVTRIRSVPGTPLFFTSGRDGDVKLWDVSKVELVNHWPKLHGKHTFLQHNTRGFGALAQGAVTDLQILRDGFVTCGSDGIVRRFRHQANEV